MEAFTLLIICYNRPEYLRRTLRGIGAAWPTTGTGPHILLSQDGNDPGVSAVAAQGAALVQEGQAAQASQAPITYQHVQHQQTRAPGDDPSGYSALARHFGWAISEAFKRPEAQYVIIVEDDLEVAVDFFGYFAAVAPVLRADPTLLAASAYNDMGQRSFVGNPARVLRSDFFPGLGWMLTRHVWAELGPKWPSGYWDDWLREPPQRQGRQVLHPEVSRTRTFGEKGVSRAQFFHKYLGNIHLNSAKVDWPSQDLRYLQKQSWDASLKQLVAAAKVESSVQALLAATCPADDLGPVLQGDSPATWSGWLPPSTLRDAAALSSRVLKVEYSGFNGPRGYESLAQQIGVISDVKARVPRTAYKGVVALRHNSCIKLLVPAQWSIDFDSQ